MPVSGGLTCVPSGEPARGARARSREERCAKTHACACGCRACRMLAVAVALCQGEGPSLQRDILPAVRREAAPGQGGLLMPMPRYRSHRTTQGRNQAAARALWRATGTAEADLAKPI